MCTSTLRSQLASLARLPLSSLALLAHLALNYKLSTFVPTPALLKITRRVVLAPLPALHVVQPKPLIPLPGREVVRPRAVLGVVLEIPFVLVPLRRAKRGAGLVQ